MLLSTWRIAENTYMYVRVVFYCNNNSLQFNNVFLITRVRDSRHNYKPSIVAVLTARCIFLCNCRY